MQTYFVVDRLGDWGADIEGAEVVTAWDYLTQEKYRASRRARVFNLCRSYRYQSAGYYVSLLASARGHHPLPSVQTIQDISSPALPTWLSEDASGGLLKSLQTIESSEFVLSVYFGKNLAQRHDRLARSIFGTISAPLVRAHFRRVEHQWTLRSVRAIPLSDVPESHTDFLYHAAQRYISQRNRTSAKKPSRFSLGVLVNSQERDAPSNSGALRAFERAFHRAGFSVTMLDKDDLARVAEFDALFLRETTAVNHHTYRFARRAQREGIVCIDDAESILRCTNKVFLAEALEAAGVPTPKTLIINRKNAMSAEQVLSFPLVLKRPDSAFSTGVVKVEDKAELQAAISTFLEDSELIIAQEFTPTEFDWRIGVMDGKPLYACRYFMARKHWQIIARDKQGKAISGDSETLPIEAVPKTILSAAVQAANSMGKGLYGVDLKQVGDRPIVIEVNDNPNIDKGIEDSVLGKQLYDAIAQYFLKQVEKRLSIKS